MFTLVCILLTECEVWRAQLTKIRLQKRNRDLLSLDMLFIQMEILEMLSDIHKTYKALNTTKLEKEVTKQMKTICEFLKSNMHKISQQQQKDVGNEVKRFHLIVQLSKVLSHDSHKMSSAHPKVGQAVTVAIENILGWKVFDENEASKSLKALEQALKVSGVVTKRERELIVKAIGLKAGHWFKCPNGHFYCIGDCGGAMVISTCNECGASIGGESHSLLSNNAHAPEMDGSSHPAWSAQQNLAYYHID